MEGDLSLAVLVSALDVRGKVVYDVSCSSVVEEYLFGSESMNSERGRSILLTASTILATAKIPSSNPCISEK